MARLSEAMGDRTLMLITHRTNLLALVDRVIVMQDGKIIADGPKDQIIPPAPRAD